MSQVHRKGGQKRKAVGAAAVGVQCSRCKKVMRPRDNWNMNTTRQGGRVVTTFVHKNAEDCS